MSITKMSKKIKKKIALDYFVIAYNKIMDVLVRDQRVQRDPREPRVQRDPRIQRESREPRVQREPRDHRDPREESNPVENYVPSSEDVNVAFNNVIGSLGFKLVDRNADPETRLKKIIDELSAGTRVPGCMLYPVTRIKTRVKNEAGEDSVNITYDNTHKSIIISTYINPFNINVKNKEIKRDLVVSSELKTKLSEFFNKIALSRNSTYESVVMRIDHPNLRQVPNFVGRDHVLFKVILKIPV
jgi:hypothetical protein